MLFMLAFLKSLEGLNDEKGKGKRILEKNYISEQVG